MGTTAKARGRKTDRKKTGSGMVKPRGGNKRPNGETVDGARRNQRQELLRIAVGNETPHRFPFLSRDHMPTFTADARA